MKFHTASSERLVCSEGPVVSLALNSLSSEWVSGLVGCLAWFLTFLPIVFIRGQGCEKKSIATSAACPVGCVITGVGSHRDTHLRWKGRWWTCKLVYNKVSRRITLKRRRKKKIIIFVVLGVVSSRTEIPHWANKPFTVSWQLWGQICKERSQT